MHLLFKTIPYQTVYVCLCIHEAMKRKPVYIWEPNNYVENSMSFAILEASVQQGSLHNQGLQSNYVPELNMGIYPTRVFYPKWGFAELQAFPNKGLLPNLRIHRPGGAASQELFLTRCFCATRIFWPAWCFCPTRGFCPLRGFCHTLYTTRGLGPR